MRLVDADYLIAEGNKDGAYGYVSVEEIAHAPTIKPPAGYRVLPDGSGWEYFGTASDNLDDENHFLFPIVRCKDCKERESTWWCPQFVAYVDEDFFCGFGERKDDETD